jgi:hypothetical protein
MAIAHYSRKATGIVPEYFASLGMRLKQRELQFLNEYLKCGNKKQAAVLSGWKEDNALASANRILAKQPAKEYLIREREKAARRAGWEYDAKLKKLKQIAVSCVPDAEHDVVPKKAMVAISAIAEANKMEGHYSAEKHVNVNVGIDTDMEEAKRLAQELLEKNRRDY